jgi:hypothetical protein
MNRSSTANGANGKRKRMAALQGGVVHCVYVPNGFGWKALANGLTLQAVFRLRMVAAGDENSKTLGFHMEMPSSLHSECRISHRHSLLVTFDGFDTHDRSCKEKRMTMNNRNLVV